MGASPQPEPNENPTTAYEKRDDFSFLFRAAPKALGDAKIAKQTPPQKKRKNKLFGLHKLIVFKDIQGIGRCYERDGFKS